MLLIFCRIHYVAAYSCVLRVFVNSLVNSCLCDRTWRGPHTASVHTFTIYYSPFIVTHGSLWSPSYRHCHKEDQHEIRQAVPHRHYNMRNWSGSFCTAAIQLDSWGCGSTPGRGKESYSTPNPQTGSGSHRTPYSKCSLKICLGGQATGPWKRHWRGSELSGILPPVPFKLSCRAECQM
jgi:hypothetical protein